jgi:hypothetical protein
MSDEDFWLSNLRNVSKLEKFESILWTEDWRTNRGPRFAGVVLSHRDRAREHMGISMPRIWEFALGNRTSTVGVWSDVEAEKDDIERDQHSINYWRTELSDTVFVSSRCYWQFPESSQSPHSVTETYPSAWQTVMNKFILSPSVAVSAVSSRTRPYEDANSDAGWWELSGFHVTGFPPFFVLPEC